jgi:curved DNA-binding protein CbpA
MSIYHQIFGIADNASLVEIKEKYRELCKIYHPDISNNELISKMALINEAYDVLTRTIKKSTNIINEDRRIYNESAVVLYDDQAFAFYRQAIRIMKELHDIQEKMKMFNNEKMLREYVMRVMKALYYFNIVCMQYGDSEYFEDSIIKIKELNRDRMIAKNIKNYSELLSELSDLSGREKQE